MEAWSGFSGVCQLPGWYLHVIMVMQVRLFLLNSDPVSLSDWYLLALQFYLVNFPMTDKSSNYNHQYKNVSRSIEVNSTSTRQNLIVETVTATFISLRCMLILIAKYFSIFCMVKEISIYLAGELGSMGNLIKSCISKYPALFTSEKNQVVSYFVLVRHGEENDFE